MSTTRDPRTAIIITLGAEPGTSFYVHNDIFRYQDDIFTDDYPPAEPVEIEKYEEDSPLPQDNGDHATQVRTSFVRWTQSNSHYVQNKIIRVKPFYNTL